MSNLIGQSLGRYHILEQLGEGGMATVYKAYDTRLEREVAIKVIRRGAFPPDQLEHMLKRFEREAKSLAKLSHPNIVGVIDYGEYEGAPYLVMVYLPGGTLRQRLGKPIPWQDAVRLLIPIAQALEYAHEHNIIHRDIKPSNILLTEKGQPMLTDFGIAKILESDETATLTGSGVGVGTPEYMAPEQWTGQTTKQSDIYSLGVVFYEMITGRKPYVADTPAAILLKQASDPLPRPVQFVPDLPDTVERILLKTLAKRAEDRYADFAEFTNALQRLSDPNGKINLPDRQGMTESGTLTQGQTADWQSQSRDISRTVEEGAPGPVARRKNNGWVWVTGVILVVFCICVPTGIGLLYMVRNGFGPITGTLSTPTLGPAIPPIEPSTLTPTIEPTSTLTPTPVPLPLAIGDWRNEDGNTRGITRIKIEYQQGDYYVQTWGSCSPTDCYWNDYEGVRYEVLDATETKMTIIWTFSFVIENLYLEILPDGRLKVVNHNTYTDNSGRADSDFTYYFNRIGY
jgi:serine/threonine protein kinase